MAGYEYRATESRRRRADEYTRQRAAAESARSARAAQQRKRSSALAKTTTKPDTVKAKEPAVKSPPASPKRAQLAKALANDGEFAVVRADPPPPRGPAPGAVKSQALAAISILRKESGEWFKVADRASKARASSYAATIRRLDNTIRTRLVVTDEGRGVLYAMAEQGETA